MEAGQPHVPVILTRGVQEPVFVVRSGTVLPCESHSGQAASSTAESCGDLEAISAGDLKRAISSHRPQGVAGLQSQTFLVCYDLQIGPWAAPKTLLDVFWSQVKAVLDGLDDEAAQVGFMALTDNGVRDMLHPTNRYIRKIPDAKSCRVADEDQFKKLLSAASTRIEGRDVLLDAVGLIQATMLQNAQHDSPIVLRFMILPAQSVKTSLAGSMSSLLRVSNVLREASELARVASGLPELHKGLCCEQNLATSATHIAGVPTGGVYFHLPIRDSPLSQLLTPALLGHQGCSLMCILLGGQNLPSGMVHLISSLLLLRPLSTYLQKVRGCIVSIPYSLSLGKATVQAIQPSRLKGLLRDTLVGNYGPNSDLGGLLQPCSPPVSPGSSVYPNVILASPRSRKSFPATQSIQGSIRTPPHTLDAYTRHTDAGRAKGGSPQSRPSYLSPQDVRAIQRALASAASPCTTTCSQLSHGPGISVPPSNLRPLLTFSAQARLQSAARMALSGLAAAGQAHDKDA